MNNNILLILMLIFFSACSTSKKAVTVIAPEKLSETLSNLPSGASISLESKEYIIDIPILIENKKNITINGNGASIVMNSLSENVIHITGSESIKIQNIKAKHIEPSGPTGCTGNVIYMDSSSDVLIEKCELNGSGIVGVAAFDIDNLSIIENNIHSNSEYGIIYQGPSILIKDNTFEKNNLGHVYYSFVEKGGASSWPPDQLINKDVNKSGLTMSNNIYK